MKGFYVFKGEHFVGRVIETKFDTSHGRVLAVFKNRRGDIEVEPTDKSSSYVYVSPDDILPIRREFVTHAEHEEKRFGASTSNDSRKMAEGVNWCLEMLGLRS